MPKFVKYRKNSKGEPTKQVELAIETSNAREGVSLRAQGFHEVGVEKQADDDDSTGEEDPGSDSADSASDQPGSSSGSRRRKR